MRQKPRIRIGRETGRGVCVMTGVVDYSFNVEVDGKRLEITLVQTKSGKFLQPAFWDRRTEDRVRMNRDIAMKIKNELIGSRI